MKRKFMTAAFISLSLALSTSFVGCKDYDDDITEINANTTGLSTQIADLKAELQQQAATLAAAAQAAQQAADQAMNAAQTAIQKGDAAMAQALLAQQAAEQAKADALAALADQAKKQADELSALRSDLQGLIDDNKANIANNAVNIAANATAIEANTKAIEENQEAIKDIQSQLLQIVADYAALQGQVTAIDERLTNEVETLNNKIAELAADLTQLIKTNELAIQANAAAIAGNTAEINACKQEIEAIKADVAANKAEIATLTTEYNTLAGQVAELEKFQAATELQLATLEEFKTNITKELSDFKSEFGDFQQQTGQSIEDLKNRVSATEADLQTLLDTTIPAIKADVTELQQRVADLINATTEINQALAAVQESLTTINTEIDTLKADLAQVNAEITRIDNALSTLNAVLGRRLSSVTFVPSAYVGGIPAIDFSSIQYVPMTQTANGNWEAATAGDTVNVASTDIKAVYRLNPSNVTLDDIDVDGLTFLCGVATSRAATESALIQVAEGGATINEAGELVLNVVKTNNGKLFSEGLKKNEINIVALKVPIATKHLLEGETEASVYSEYVRLSEFQLTPQIGQVGVTTADKQFSDSSTAYTDADVETYKVSFNETKDLLEIADAVLLNNNEWYMSLDTPEERASYSLDLKFHMSKEENLVDGVDQQLFGKVEGSVFTPVVPEGYSAQSIIGMTPIVTVTLVDTKNNKVVDQRYIKLEISAKKLEAEIDYPEFTSNLFCGDTTFAVTWDAFAENVLSKCGDDETGYLTKDEFIKYYVTEGTSTVTYFYADGADSTGLVADFVADADNALTWTVNADQVGTVDKSKVVKVVLTLTNELRGTITITFNLKVTLDDTQMPTLGTTDQLYWVNETMMVYPTNPALGGLAEYKTNIVIGRNQPYVLNLLDCASYYMFLDVDSGSPASLTWDETALFTDEYSLTAANQDQLGTTGNVVYFNIENDSLGIAMVQAEATVDMNWKAYLNGQTANNLVNFGVSHFKIVKPLYITTVDGPAKLVDNAKLITDTITDYFNVTDYYRNQVYGALGENEDLFDFYGIEGVTYGPDSEIILADNPEGTLNPRKPAAIGCYISVDTAGILSYRNDGAVLQNKAYILVPVSIKHRWGVLESTIVVPLLPRE